MSQNFATRNFRIANFLSRFCKLCLKLSTKIPVTHFLTEMCTRNPSRNFVPDLQILHGNVRNSGIPIPGGVPPRNPGEGGVPPPDPRKVGGGTPPNFGGGTPPEMPNSGLGGGTPPNFPWEGGVPPPRNPGLGGGTPPGTPGRGGYPPGTPESEKNAKKCKKMPKFPVRDPPGPPESAKKCTFFRLRRENSRVGRAKKSEKKRIFSSKFPPDVQVRTI